MLFRTTNPATEENLTSYKTCSVEEVQSKIEDAKLAFRSWKNVEFTERAQILQEVARELNANKRDLALLMTREMGKPISQSVAEIEKCAGACNHYAEQGANYLQPEVIPSDAPESFVCYEPLGLILAIMPWNFPFWQVFRFAAPALMAGNGCLLKHAANVTGCALAIEELLLRAGLPAGLFSTLILADSEVEPVIANPAVRAVTLTGSCRAGSAVASAAGSNLKKSVLELGGSDAYVVLADADLDLAARMCASSRMNNNGQVCISAKRLIVEETVVDRFEELLLLQMREYTPGDPELDDTNQGPMARLDLRENLHRQVTETLAEGARCLLGGQQPQGKGYYYPATVLSGVEPGMTGFREEVFGPVACIVTASDENDAIAKANDSEFGLGAAIFSGDIVKARDIAAHRLDAGICVVNDFVRSDPRLPFGGIKSSGYGRELSAFGMREFVNIKTVYTS